MTPVYLQDNPRPFSAWFYRQCLGRQGWALRWSFRCLRGSRCNSDCMTGCCCSLMLFVVCCCRWRWCLCGGCCAGLCGCCSCSSCYNWSDHCNEHVHTSLWRSWSTFWLRKDEEDLPLSEIIKVGKLEWGRKKCLMLRRGTHLLLCCFLKKKTHPLVAAWWNSYIVAERAQEDVIPHATMVGAVCWFVLRAQLGIDLLGVFVFYYLFTSCSHSNAKLARFALPVCSISSRILDGQPVILCTCPKDALFNIPGRYSKILPDGWHAISETHTHTQPSMKQTGLKFQDPYLDTRTREII